MPRLPANAALFLRFALTPLSVALLTAIPAIASARDVVPVHPAKPATPVPSVPSRPADADSPWLPLKLERSLSESRPVSRDTSPTYARADHIEGSVDERIVLEGNAEVRRGGMVLRGDRIIYTQATDQVDVEGHARVFARGGTFSGPQLSFRVDAQTGSMPDAQFTYPARNGRGEATLVEFLSEQRARMENAKFTTCAPGDDAWWVKVESAEIDSLEQSATATWGYLYFQGIPILASPFFGFPIGNQRRSGFLTPTFGLSSTLGTDIRTPYYWNIAPNYDYTISPRVMSKRGVLLGNEFRILEPTFSGTLLYDVIPDDRQTGSARDYTGVTLSYNGLPGVAAGVNYNRVSDDNYFVDFSSTILGSAQKILPQDAFVSYTESYWNTAVRVTKNQVLQDPLAPVTPPYERVPQVTMTGFVADWRGWEAGAIVDATRFTNPQAGLQDGGRYIINPRVAYPIEAASWFITPRAQLSATYYSLDPQFYPNDHTQTRVLPILSLDSGLIFERDVQWFGRSSQQTLEPRLYYAYIPFRAQNQLPNFDSALADLNYAQFFTENIYSGYDRIVNANQLTLALATRILDQETGAERLRAAVGQRYYFTDQKVTLPGETPRASSESDLLAAIYAQLGYQWAAEIALQYSAETSAISRATAGMRWQPRRASVISAYYRYQQNTADNTSTGSGTNQVDLSAQWPLSDRWYGVGRYNYSFENSKPVEIIAGFEYKADCWVARFAYQRFQTTTASTTSNFYFQLELTGLTSVGTNALSQLQRNIPGYQRINPLPRQPGMFEYYE
ncbi:MAG TPA: LPS-assembly protein LptD [Burkholderiaceae bacterium]|nr:LPS-assembly protein LptD [Burkholderiaceae bacterium]